MRHAWIEVDLAALARNTQRLRAHVAPAALCAVVKADGYGHGAVPVALAALEAGASVLAVAIVDEGAALRDAGIDAPILLLSECPDEDLDEVVRLGLTPTVYRDASIDAAERAAERAGVELGVHVKVDTGMRRVGAPAEAVGALVDRIARSSNLRMDGLFTHFAVADEPDDPFTDEQVRRFDDVRHDLSTAGLPTGMVHAANSAAALRGVGRGDMVRCGISLYGFAPSPAMTMPLALDPVLSLHARLSYVKTVQPGEGVSYGLRWRADHPTRVATVPLGYADGVRRILSSRGAQVLVGGRRCPIVGTITMDQLLVDLGSDASTSVGDEVVLLGPMGDEQITAQEWADRLDTITYEIVCGFSARLPRLYRGAGAASSR
ncbi:MAG: alanine racemase [Actinobacteria bacterium]|nr:alanine racemase [Actinomycetota bacterium]